MQGSVGARAGLRSRRSPAHARRATVARYAGFCMAAARRCGRLLWLCLALAAALARPALVRAAGAQPLPPCNAHVLQAAVGP